MASFARGWGAWPVSRRALLLAALVALGTSLRACQLEWPPLWSDEAESAVNALTVLGTGLPRDSYLEMPIFENTLVRPWPEHPEYEFKDLSYSARGVAVYHGWLPLYAMAAAFRLAGVSPEEARRGPPLTESSAAEMARWTAVPRWPAIAFSAVFILLCFSLGRAVGDEGTGWIMATTASVAAILVYLGRQARYYSPTLALTAACGLLVWRACRHGRLRDFALSGLAIGLLFHTHSLSAVVMTLVFAAALPLSPEPRRLPMRLAVAGLGAGLLVLPWVAWSGFLGQLGYIPPARDLLSLGEVLLVLPRKAPLVALAGGLGLLWWAAARTLGTRLPPRARRPVLDLGPGLYFAGAWATVAFLGFVFLVPAASFFALRLELTVAVPGVLLLGLLLTALQRLVVPRGGAAASLALLLPLLAGSGQIRLPSWGPTWAADEAEIVRFIRGWELGPGARVLATPNTHLILTYYSGVPVQSVSAMRRAWLESFDGPLVVVEHPRFLRPPREQLRRLLEAHHRSMDEVELRRFENHILRLISIQDLARDGYDVEPPPRPLDPLESEAAELTRRWTRLSIGEELQGTPLGLAVSGSVDWAQVWHHFFYWFVAPGERTGSRLNFHDRARRGHTLALDGGWIVHDCREVQDPPLVPPRLEIAPGGG